MKPPVLSKLSPGILSSAQELDALYKVRAELAQAVWEFSSIDLWLNFWFVKGSVREQVISYEISGRV